MERKDPRYRVDREATIILGRSKMRCRVCDSSRGGAKLAFPFSEWLPPRFVLEDAGVRRQVVLEWQGSEHIGVRYVDPLAQKKGARSLVGADVERCSRELAACAVPRVRTGSRASRMVETGLTLGFGHRRST